VIQKKQDARDDDDIVDGGDVAGGEGGGDYVIGGDGVAVVHGVQMALPFHMNVPALLGWEKGGSDSGKKITGKSHPGKGASVIMEKEAKNPSGSVVSFVDKSSGPRKVEKEAKNPSGNVVDKSSGPGKVPGSKKEVVMVGAKDPPTLSLGGGIPLPGGMQLLSDVNV